MWIWQSRVFCGLVSHRSKLWEVANVNWTIDPFNFHQCIFRDTMSAVFITFNELKSNGEKLQSSNGKTSIKSKPLMLATAARCWMIRVGSTIPFSLSITTDDFSAIDRAFFYLLKSYLSISFASMSISHVPEKGLCQMCLSLRPSVLAFSAISHGLMPT